MIGWTSNFQCYYLKCIRPLNFHGCNSEGFLDKFLDQRVWWFWFVLILFLHKPGWVFLFLNPYVFLRKEMYQGILLIIPSSFWHSLTECHQICRSSLSVLIPSHQWCQSPFTPASQFTISTQAGRRTTSFRGLFWWRLTRKLCGEGPIQFWFFSLPISIFPAKSSTPTSYTSMWPNRVNRTDYLY